MYALPPNQIKQILLGTPILVKMIATGQHRLGKYNQLNFKNLAPEDEPNSALPVTSLWYELRRALCKGRDTLVDCRILWALV